MEDIFQDELTPFINSIQQILLEIYSYQITSEQITIEYSKKYLKKLEKNTYSNNLGLIRSIEQKIIEYFINNGIPGKSNYAKISAPKYKDKLHAWITAPLDNHRILYSYS